MIYFPDTILKRYILVTRGGAGLYGETIQNYEYSEDIVVDFQNESNNEIAHEYGVELKDLYKIYTDITTPLNDTDQLEDEAGHKYDIIGGVQKYSKFHKYQKAHIIKRRSP